jgi:hypothetical protein
MRDGLGLSRPLKPEGREGREEEAPWRSPLSRWTWVYRRICWGGGKFVDGASSERTSQNGQTLRNMATRLQVQSELIEEVKLD